MQYVDPPEIKWQPYPLHRVVRHVSQAWTDSHFDGTSGEHWDINCAFFSHLHLPQEVTRIFQYGCYFNLQCAMSWCISWYLHRWHWLWTVASILWGQIFVDRNSLYRDVTIKLTVPDTWRCWRDTLLDTRLVHNHDNNFAAAQDAAMETNALILILVPWTPYCHVNDVKITVECRLSPWTCAIMCHRALFVLPSMLPNCRIYDLFMG